MFHIKILVLGKLKEKYWENAENEYIKRLSPYAKIEIIELVEEPFREGDDREKIKAKEAEKIKKNIPEGVCIFVLHEYGKPFTSPQFAQLLQKNSTRGETLFFIVGGPLGLHENILRMAAQQISLSSLTFPHQMVRTILLEQIYRATTILKGKNYHY